MRVAISGPSPAATGAAVRAERLEHRRHVGVGGGLVARHRHVVGVDPPHVDAVGLRRGDDLVGAAGHPGQHGVEVRVVHQLHSPSSRRRSPRRGRAPAARSRSGPRRRGSSRTSRPSPPAAPARCRCCWSPCRGGCAVRGSAATAGRPGAVARRPTPRPGGPATAGRVWRARPGSRRAGRRIPSARRSAVRCRRRRRRRSHRAG